MIAEYCDLLCKVAHSTNKTAKKERMTRPMNTSAMITGKIEQESDNINTRRWLPPYKRILNFSRSLPCPECGNCESCVV